MGRALFVFGLLSTSVVSLAAPAAATEFPLYCEASVHAVGTPYETTDFDFAVRAVGGHSPYSFHWDFDDGQSSDERTPHHTYAQGGYYVVTLVVTDSGDPVSTCQDTLIALSHVVIDPGCIAAADSTWGVSPLTIGFHGQQAFFATDSYQWSFGDGATSTLQHPTHTYTSPGTYWVHLYGSETPYPYFECMPVHRVSVIPPELLAVGGASPQHGVQLRPARPNPFVGSTTFGFELPRPGRVRLRVFDASGRLVASLVDGERPAGVHTATWNGRRDDARPGAAGVYFAALEYEGASETVRLVRMR